MKVELHRLYLTDATHGCLLVDGIAVCNTIELPWKDNQRNVSCIPEGHYPLIKRYSAKFKDHFLVQEVINRNSILIHPANDAQRELRGCIAPVTQLIDVGCGNYSKRAMDKLKVLFGTQLLSGPIVLTIKQATDEAIINQLTL